VARRAELPRARRRVGALHRFEGRRLRDALDGLLVDGDVEEFRDPPDLRRTACSRK